MILTVRQLTEQIRNAVEGRFPYVWVQGEVTDMGRPSSGHVYFSLKDDNAMLRCVWFRGNQKERETFDPLTGEVFEDGPRISLVRTLANGQKCLCAGRLSVYSPRGEYQLIVELAQNSGEGQLHLELEALRRKLEARGYFRLERKRRLPEHPMRVALITAPRGAAIQDFLRLAEERGTGFEIRLLPVPVQGTDAPPCIVEAIQSANSMNWADVIVLIRGGGSLQDLWAFNDERVADAVFTSRIPVVAGIGHEIDTSLTDMTADIRAATPSHAAQLLWQERSWYAQRLDDLERALTEAFSRHLATRENSVRELSRMLDWVAPVQRLNRSSEHLTSIEQRLNAALERHLSRSASCLEQLENSIRTGIDRLNRHDIALQHERIITLTRRLELSAQQIFRRAEQKTADLSTRLETVFSRTISQTEHTLERLELMLAAGNPEAPLRRGYACAMTKDGRFVRSIRDLQPGNTFTIKVLDGEADAKVITVRESGD